MIKNLPVYALAAALFALSATVMVRGQVTSGPNTPIIGMPNTRAISTGTAYQATDPSRAAMVEVSIASVASLSISGGATNAAAVYVSATNSVGSSGGIQVCSYNNANTGTLIVGINTNASQTSPCTFNLPVGAYFAVRVSSGSVTLPAASDQSIG